MEDDSFSKGFKSVQKDFGVLQGFLENYVSAALDDAELSYFGVTSRIKSEDSALSKWKDKGYENPFSEMHDILGLRVIVYAERDIESVNGALRNLFEVDEKNTVDKRSPSAVDRVGYRSYHIIASIGDKVSKSAISERLRKLPFEIQVRTAFEHCWAQTEHQLSYKSDHALPKGLERRLRVLSGTLELLDQELSAIVGEAQEYKEKVARGSSETAKDPLTAASMEALAVRYYKNVRKSGPLRTDERFLDMARRELQRFGIKSNQSLEKLLQDVPREFRFFGSTIISFFRSAMILRDPEKYFTKVYDGRWRLGRLSKRELSKYAPISDFDKRLNDWNVRLLD